jgi:hypothetical protein
MRGRTRCAVSVTPDVIEAGAEIALKGRVSGSPVCDLRGRTLQVKDQAGADTASLEFTDFDGETNETGELVVTAPVEPGDYAWMAVCPPFVQAGVSYEESSTAIPFTVKPHATNVVAWDIPSALVAGERFRIRIGIKCSNECPLANRDLGIYNHEGTRVATGTLTGDLWPGTTGLYVAEVELEAPAGEGLYPWSLKGPDSAAGIPHAESSVSFGVRVVGRPECLVRVEIVDQDSQTPVGHARVVLHPYKAVADERGVAQVRVASGPYRLFVSQTGYLTFSLPVEVTTDLTVKAELSLEPVLDRN